MADILCPHCNMPNPDDQNVCSFCRQPLHIAANDEAIRPGDMPTKKTTAELEPLLPQWLRDTRSRARQDAEDEQAEQAAAELAKPASEEPSAPDWLAGLEAAARDEDEEKLPDWMRGIGPAEPAPAPKREPAPKPNPLLCGARKYRGRMSLLPRRRRSSPRPPVRSAQRNPRMGFPTG